MDKTEEQEKTTQELKKGIEEVPAGYRPPHGSIEEIVRKQLTPLFADFIPNSSKYLLYKKYKSKFSEKRQRTLQFLGKMGSNTASY